MIHIKRVLFPTDFSETAEEALAQAAEVARFFSAELIVLHVLRTPASDSLTEDVKENFKAVFDTIEKDAHKRISALSEVPELIVHRVVRWGDAVAPAILEQAATTSTDLVVMATHGRRALSRWWVGSVTQEVIREADVPVLTLRRREHGLDFSKARRILVPVDFSKPSLEALAYARELAVITGASLHLLHVMEIPIYPGFYGTPGTGAVAAAVYDPAALRERSEQELKDLVERPDGPAARFETQVEQGRPADWIVEVANTRPADLVVMASHGLTGLSRLLTGSVTEAVMRRVNRPLLIVPPSADPGFSSAEGI